MTETRGGEVRHFDHPGAGRRRAKATPKGRGVDLEALEAVRALLGDRPRRRDLLVEHLHLIQDRYGQLSAAHLAALADEMRLALAEVYETATFYAHFDVVKEGEAALAPLVVRVCDSITCELFGAEGLLKQLRGLADAGKLGQARVVRAPCLGLCDQAPAVEVGHHFLHRADPSAVLDAIARGDTHPHIPSYIDYDT
jgi:formate dehydrogenase